jgi:NAD(P)-dependent dehydrogenase (short-subunit alcohol dehydrogenase family)
MVSAVASRFGQIDVLVNNVAITDHKTVLDLDEDEWERVLRVTLTSVFLCCKYVGGQMVQQGRGGSIINMASTSGHRGRANATSYTAAKGGVLNLTRSLAIQLAPYKIRVNSLTPNRIGSPVGEDLVREGGSVKNLVGRNGVPLDVANAALFLASDDAAFITAADLMVDGGALAAAGF